MLFVYGTLLVCTVLLGLLVYRYDMYEREPWYMLLIMAALGAAAMWGVGAVEVFTLRQFADPWSPALIGVIASTHEEGARLLLVAALAIFIPSQFNDPMDGLIYGSMVGLGMAVAESIGNSDFLYPDAKLLPATEVVRLAGHLVLGGITTFALGMARMRMKRWKLMLAGCLAFTLTWHFLWDWLAFTVANEGRMTAWQTALSVVIMLAGMLVYGMLVVVGTDWSAKVFRPHAPRELWGWPFNVIFPAKSVDAVAADSDEPPPGDRP